MSEMDPHMREWNGIPNTIKILMIFIDRVGFPVMAFLLMFYMSFFTLKQVTGSIAENTKALVELKNSVNKHTRLTEPAIEKILGKAALKRARDASEAEEE